MMNANGSQAIVKCRPPRACFGTCGADVRASLIAALDATNDTDLEYSDCPGGRGQELCSPGYEGPRCSQCTPMTPGGTCSDDDPNGYYRLDGRCEVRRGLCRAQHCQLTTLILVCLPAVPMQRVRPVVDGRSCDRALRSHGSSGGQVRSCSVRLLCCALTRVHGRIHGMRRLGDNFSTLTAPLVIVLTFGQTLGSLLDLQCPWPKLLREWMQFLDMFNINLELAR